MYSSFTARVALLSPPYTDLTYSLPSYLPVEAFFVGQRIAVPLGKGVRVGVILDIRGGAGEEEPSYALKDILWPLDRENLLSERYLEFLRQLANRHMESMGRILGSVLPAGLRTTGVRVRFFGIGAPKEYQVSALAALRPEELAECGALWVRGQADIRKPGVSAQDADVCVLAADPPWPVRPVATAQNALLEYLFEHGAVTRRTLLDALGKGAGAALATLVQRALVNIVSADAPRPEDVLSAARVAVEAGMEGVQRVTLTPEQSKALEDLTQAVMQGKAATHLLFGITGSGKTEVYLALAERVLAMGKSVVVLAPEVALALKLWRDAEERLPLSSLPETQRHLFHGSLSPTAKERLFRLLAETGGGGSPRLVVGTRSTLLLPMNNIGLIVLDEEHDASFKQDEGLIYQAKELAWYLAGQQSALLLMGSATPDVKSFYAARQGLVPLHVLSERVEGRSLPDVRLVALPKARSGGGTSLSLLAPESAEALKDVVERGEQAVILLNRRGYAPLMYCLDCKQTVKCPYCDIALTYHKGRERLVCHYCGYTRPYPSPCSACKGLHFLPMGEGTEKLEEHLASVLPPGTGVLRLDRDSTRRPGRMQEILESFARKEASVLVGTQMLSKGHHFPDVTLALVLDADLGLNMPDYRAAESTFQLLLQSAGRSGRGEKPGRVFIQTRDPQHYCWEYVFKAEYEGFYERELALRQRRRYPPFVRLGLLRISHAVTDAKGPETVALLGTTLRSMARELGVTLLGPAPAPIALLKGRKLWHCLLKGDDWNSLRAVYAKALTLPGVTGYGGKHAGLVIRLDLDPMSML